MQVELREKLIDAVEKSVRHAGAKDYEGGLGTAKKLIAWVSNRVDSMQTLDDLRAVLDSFPPLSKKEAAIGLFIVNNIPQIVRFVLKVTAKKAAATLPAINQGRPVSIPVQKAREVLDYISILHRKGYSFKTAKMRTAQKFDCHVRTIERLWLRRANIENDDAPVAVTIDDVMAFFNDGQSDPSDCALIAAPKDAVVEKE